MAILTEGFNGFGGTSAMMPSELPNINDYDHDKFGFQRAIAEAYQDMATVVEAIAEYDIMELNIVNEAKSSGVSMESLMPVYETGMVDKAKEIFAKIKKFLQDLWAKIKQFFKTAVAFILSLFMKGKEFVKKYKSELSKHASKKVELQRGFKYSNLETSADIKGAKSYFTDGMKTLGESIKEYSKLDKDSPSELVDQISETLKKDMEAYKEAKDDILDATRGAVVGESSVSAERYSEKLFAYFRNGRNEYGQVEWTVSEAMKILESDYTKSLKEAENEVNSMFNNTISDMKKYESISEKVPEKVRSQVIASAREASSFFSSIQSILGAGFKAKKDAISSAEVMAKKVCLVAISGKADDK